MVITLSYKVFISHSTKDEELVEYISTVLTNYGITPIIATKVRSIPPTTISKKVQELIDSCQAVLAILTINGIQSPWVQQEIGYCIKSGKPIVSLVDSRIHPEKLAFLQGSEHVIMDRRNIEEAVHQTAQWLYHLKIKKEKSDILAALIVGAFLLWALSSE